MPPSVTFPKNLSFTGKAVLVTGGSTGLGLETAIHYVTLGASPVIITARNRERGKAAVAAIESRTGKKGIVQVRSLDMNSFVQVKKFVESLEEEVPAIDIVLLNAGCFSVDYKLSTDGWEQDLQVNTLATSLLALLLLPWMRSIKQIGKVQHLGIVGSGTHTAVDIVSPKFPKKDVLKYFNDKENYRFGPPTYAMSKLLVHYAAREIAKLAVQPYGSPSPIVTIVCPGRVSTSLARDFAEKGFLQWGLVWAFKTLATLPTDVGARQLVLAGTTSPEENGKFIRPYMTDAKYDESAAKVITNEEGKKMQEAVWGEILEVLAATIPEVKGIAYPVSYRGMGE